MPAIKKVSREDIIDAAVEVLREGGFSAVNARSVAQKLGCSTQPTYFSFRNMSELKQALTDRATEMHKTRVRDSLRACEGIDTRYSSYGMGFVRFAAEEKQLFRWLYIDGGQTSHYKSDVLYDDIIDVIVEDFGYDRETAENFHRDMLYYSYGLAILANIGHLGLDDKELRMAFSREFRALTSLYGKPPKSPEFAMKAEFTL